MKTISIFYKTGEVDEIDCKRAQFIPVAESDQLIQMKLILADDSVIRITLPISNLNRVVGQVEN